ncbi:MAG TPA: NADH-quinone oxidoreductase subunit C [Streptosporangiaceae bacterium]|nr:NADH-quinone oxidoreductase subunit C [Streptosporangiaceae bacterium]
MTADVMETGAAALWDTLEARVAAGERFAGLFATARQEEDTLVLSAHVAREGGIGTLEAMLAPGAGSYPALTPRLGAAFWYEREIHDHFGVVPQGHPRLAPLVLHGSPEDHALPRHVAGYGMFTIPHGPVRSGVTESIEYLVETPGEAIPHLNMRVFYKHRGIERRFEGMTVADGVLLAERTEGIASVAHALAYCHAAEQIAGCVPPRAAGLVRVLHAELERIANHLDVAGKLANAGGLAVAEARFALHKERVLRLVSGLCGSRFGRGVVVPGGVSALPRQRPAEILSALGRLEKAITADADALMDTASFLDRLRGTGRLDPGRARDHGALGPIGKASAFSDDGRFTRPYDAYPSLGLPAGRAHDSGDALARLDVRWDEVAQSFLLLRQAVAELAELADAGGPQAALRAACGPPGGAGGAEGVSGRAVGWAEAPQGEVLYDVTLEDGRITRCRPRSASFHNLVLMHEVFAGDILTDFPFIEASFGLSVAGVAL